MKRFLCCVCFTLLFCVNAFAQQKRIVVLEIDVHPDIAKIVDRSDVMLITETIRREAVRALPRDKYSVMGIEMIHQLGVSDLAKTNDAVELGRTLMVNYTVAGKLSRVQKDVLLTIDIYDAEIGNIVASAKPILVRPRNMKDLLNQSAEVCADMFMNFMK